MGWLVGKPFLFFPKIGVSRYKASYISSALFILPHIEKEDTRQFSFPLVTGKWFVTTVQSSEGFCNAI